MIGEKTSSRDQNQRARGVPTYPSGVIAVPHARVAGFRRQRGERGSNAFRLLQQVEEHGPCGRW